MAGGMMRSRLTTLITTTAVFSMLLTGCAQPSLSLAPAAAPIRPGSHAKVAPLQVAQNIPTDISVGTEGLKRALIAVDHKDAALALQIAQSLPDLDKLIVEWMLIRRDVPGLSSAFITDFASHAPDWPTPQLMRRRAEAAILRENAAPAQTIAAFGTMAPVSSDGVLALARAYVAVGQPGNAGRVVGRFWLGDMVDSETDAQFLREFGNHIPADDLNAHWRRLMYADKLAQAEKVAHFLGADFVAMTAAKQAVSSNQPTAAQKLAAIGGAMRNDPIYHLAVISSYRRANRSDLAAQALMQAPADSGQGAAEAWWVERRITSRDLIERGDAATAYRVVTTQRGGEPKTQAESAFHAGWYALRFLRNPAMAIPHFETLGNLASTAGTRARAAYWLGRSLEAGGRAGDAANAYTRAAQEPSTFYGQLAHVALGRSSLSLPPMPVASAQDREDLNRDTLGRVLQRMMAAGYEDDTTVLYSELAKRATRSGQFAVLAQLAEANDSARAAMQIGSIGVQRGFQTDRIAYPVNAIPNNARLDPAVERPVIFALSRQESNFDPEIVSSAGAIGLMQLMPPTAKRTAQSIGLPYSAARLKEPAYNAALGSAHLHSLLDDFNGSYILTFAAYNAGKSRVNEWIQRFGDPRDPKVDPIDWIESIPFGETRGYVQKVTENLEVYRARLNGARLMILEDLHRGRM